MDRSCSPSFTTTRCSALDPSAASKRKTCGPGSIGNALPSSVITSGRASASTLTSTRSRPDPSFAVRTTVGRLFSTASSQAAQSSCTTAGHSSRAQTRSASRASTSWCASRSACPFAAASRQAALSAARAGVEAKHAAARTAATEARTRRVTGTPPCTAGARWHRSRRAGGSPCSPAGDARGRRGAAAPARGGALAGDGAGAEGSGGAGATVTAGASFGREGRDRLDAAPAARPSCPRSAPAAAVSRLRGAAREPEGGPEGEGGHDGHTAARGRPFIRTRARHRAGLRRRDAQRPREARRRASSRARSDRPVTSRWRGRTTDRTARAATCPTAPRARWAPRSARRGPGGRRRRTVESARRSSSQYARPASSVNAMCPSA